MIEMIMTLLTYLILFLIGVGLVPILAFMFSGQLSGLGVGISRLCWLLGSVTFNGTVLEQTAQGFQTRPLRHFKGDTDSRVASWQMYKNGSWQTLSETSESISRLSLRPFAVTYEKHQDLIAGQGILLDEEFSDKWDNENYIGHTRSGIMSFVPVEFFKDKENYIINLIEVASLWKQGGGISIQRKIANRSLMKHAGTDQLGNTFLAIALVLTMAIGAGSALAVVYLA